MNTTLFRGVEILHYHYANRTDCLPLILKMSEIRLLTPYLILVRLISDKGVPHGKNLSALL